MALLNTGQAGSFNAFAASFATTKRAAVTGQTADTGNGGRSVSSGRSDGISMSSTTASTCATAEMVSFSITYPDGTVVSTSMSRAQFQDALASNDPKVFGAVSDGNGTLNGRDAVLAALGLDPAGSAAGGSGPTTPVQVSPAIAAQATAREFGASGAEIAVAVLRAGAGSNDAAGDHAASTNTAQPTQAASATVSSVPGTANGMTATIAFSTASVASLSTIATRDAAAEGVSFVA